MCEYWGIDLTCVTGTCIDDPDNWEYGYYCDCGSYEASTWSEDGSPTCVSGKSSESVTIHYSACLQHRCVCLTPFPVYTSECMQHLCAVSALKHLKTTAVFACVHLLEAPLCLCKHAQLPGDVTTVTGLGDPLDVDSIYSEEVLTTRHQVLHIR